MVLSTPAELPPSPRDRERTALELSVHFARDHLGLKELERRLDRAYGATRLSELASLTSDLPALPEDALPREASGTSAVPVDRSLPVVGHQMVAALMGGAERAGRWTPPRRLTALAVMGGVELDFRDAVLASEVVEVTALAVMGGVEIVVPPGMRVDVGGLAVMGGFERMTVGLEPTADAPLLKVGGLALMGGVEVKVRLPGETEREARRRLKEARRRGGRHAP